MTDNPINITNNLTNMSIEFDDFDLIINNSSDSVDKYDFIANNNIEIKFEYISIIELNKLMCQQIPLNKIKLYLKKIKSKL
jgi:hypothetical protein